MSRFQAGQIWQYKTRAGEESSRLTIVKVEAHPKLGTIIHIQLKDVAIKSSKAPDGISRVVSHLPFSEEAVDKSVTTKEKDGTAPAGWEEGYGQWKSAVDSGKGGIWTIPVSEAIASLEHILSKK
jgi:hypothetical protein